MSMLAPNVRGVWDSQCWNRADLGLRVEPTSAPSVIGGLWAVCLVPQLSLSPAGQWVPVGHHWVLLKTRDCWMLKRTLESPNIDIFSFRIHLSNLLFAPPFLCRQFWISRRVAKILPSSWDTLHGIVLILAAYMDMAHLSKLGNWCWSRHICCWWLLLVKLFCWPRYFVLTCLELKHSQLNCRALLCPQPFQVAMFGVLWPLSSVPQTIDDWMPFGQEPSHVNFQSQPKHDVTASEEWLFKFNFIDNLHVSL